MPLNRTFCSAAARVILPVLFAAALHGVAYGDGKVVGPKVRKSPFLPDVRLVLIRVQYPRCCDPCRRSKKPCIPTCCSPGSKPFDVKAVVTSDFKRPEFENVPDGTYLIALEIGGRLTDSLTEEPFLVKSGKTSKIEGRLTIDGAPAKAMTDYSNARQ